MNGPLVVRLVLHGFVDDCRSCNVAEKMSLIQIKAGMAELFGLLAQARANQAGPLAGWLAGMQTGKHHVTRIPKSSTWIFYIFHAWHERTACSASVPTLRDI